MNSIRTSPFVVSLIIGLPLFIPQSHAKGQCVPRDYRIPRTQTEVVDIVFVIDGSESIKPADFRVQKEGIENCIVGPNAFIPHDGTVALGVIQFSEDPYVEIHLSVIDSAATASAIAFEIDQICQRRNNTYLDEGLNAAIDMFRTEALGNSFYLVVSTDINDAVNPQNPNEDDRLQLGEEIRTKTLRAAGMAHPATICTVFVNSEYACSAPRPEDTPNAFLRLLANTADSGALLDPARPGQPAYPRQPVGQFNCADDAAQFLTLCLDCTCPMRHVGAPDCDGNGFPYICEYDDCNSNGVGDPCDIAEGRSRDWNHDGVPDECQALGAAIYVDENPAITEERDGTSWERAFLTVQQGLAEARAHPEKKLILVAHGMYEPYNGAYDPDKRLLSFDLVNGVAMLGGFAGYDAADPFERKPQAFEPVRYASVLSGDLVGNDQPGFINNGDNSYHVVTADNTVTSSTILDGFFIVGGNTDYIYPHDRGGGLRMSGASPRIFNCTITANSASDSGGGVGIDEGSPWLSNIVVARNRTTSPNGLGGGGIYCSGATNTLCVNSTIVWNESAIGGGIAADGMTIENSIIWGNHAGQIQEMYGAALSPRYCDIQGGWNATRILNVDPMFLDPDGADNDPDTWEDNDYHLSGTSPCIDAGDNAAAARPLQDFELENRVQECVVDMGADETPFYHDCNANGQHDGCEVQANPGIDCNDNGRPDTCDVADGSSSDCHPCGHGDGIPDECQGLTWLIYDRDGDCDIDQADFAAVQECYSGQSVACAPSCQGFDADADGDVDADDLPQFEAQATGPGIFKGDESCGGGSPAPGPGPDPCDTPEQYFTITAWRSVRTHGAAGPLGIALDPTASAEAAVIEPRQGEIQIIEVDLTQPAFPWTDLGFVYVYGSDASQPSPMSYAFINGDQTFRLFFDATDPDNRLNDGVCYTIDLSQAIISPDFSLVLCDATCAIRMLAGDVDGDALVEQVHDVDAIAAANGQTAGASNARLDVNVDGIINTTDSGIAGGLLDNTVVCSGSGMMMAMGWANEGVGPTGGADALVGTFTLDLSRKGQGSVSAAMVVHDTGATSVTLPAAGGTISVDVVISTAARIWGFEGRPAVDAANVVSIDAANWTELDNVMLSYGQPSATLTSYYDLTVMDWVWFAAGPNGEEIMGSDIEPLLSENAPLTSSGDVKGRPVVMTLVDDLSALDGPISTPLTDPGESVQGQWFTTSAALGGATRTPTGPGQTVVATLSVTISGTPGTYHLTLSDARFVNIAYNAVPMPVEPLEIVVGGQ